MADEKKPANIDDLVKGIRSAPVQDVDDAFKKHDAFMKEENQDHIYNNVFQPGVDTFYQTFSKELGAAFEGNDEVKVSKKDESKLKHAMTESLAKYFGKTSPSILKALDKLGIKGDDRFDHLVSYFGSTHLESDRSGRTAPIDLKDTIEEAMKRGTTVGSLKKQVSQSKETYIQGGMTYLAQEAQTHHFGSFQSHEIALRNKPLLEKAGIEIADASVYLDQGKGVHIGVVPSHLKKGTQIDYKAHGLKKK